MQFTSSLVYAVHWLTSSGSLVHGVHWLTTSSLVHGMVHKLTIVLVAYCTSYLQEAVNLQFTAY